VISAVRNIRASLNVSPAKEADLSIRGSKTHVIHFAKMKITSKDWQN